MMYLKLKLTDENKIIDYCFMKSEVSINEISEKAKELISLFDNKNKVKLSIGY